MARSTSRRRVHRFHGCEINRHAFVDMPASVCGPSLGNQRHLAYRKRKLNERARSRRVGPSTSVSPRSRSGIRFPAPESAGKGWQQGASAVTAPRSGQKQAPKELARTFPLPPAPVRCAPLSMQQSALRPCRIIQIQPSVSRRVDSSAARPPCTAARIPTTLAFAFATPRHIGDAPATARSCLRLLALTLPRTTEQASRLTASRQLPHPAAAVRPTMDPTAIFLSQVLPTPH